jgi:hypothetical protein
MRATIARALYTDDILISEGITRQSVYSGDVDTPVQRPYIVLRWGTTNPGVDVSRQRSLVVWVHDQPNDYARIDRIIKRTRTVLTGIVARQTDVGWITAIDWLTDSDDLSDDGTHTILRTSAYNIVASGQ